MDVGMLWLDDGGQADLDSRVRQAAESYRSQTGQMPSLCLVNPKLLENEELARLRRVGDVALEANPSLLPNYFWIGQGERSAVGVG
ncbi:MAG: hypothetical protein DWG76_07885 [Chloroflexi bacterium]|nr:hypothetical protein [Chloroflexota bacterium]